MIYEQYEDVIEDCKAWLADSELSGQAKDSEVILMKNWLDETTEHLNQMTLDCDAYALFSLVYSVHITLYSWCTPFHSNWFVECQRLRYICWS